MRELILFRRFLRLGIGTGALLMTRAQLVERTRSTMVVGGEERFKTLILLFEENRARLLAHLLPKDTQGGQDIAQKQHEEDDRQDIHLPLVRAGHMSQLPQGECIVQLKQIAHQQEGNQEGQTT